MEGEGEEAECDQETKSTFAILYVKMNHETLESFRLKLAKINLCITGKIAYQFLVIIAVIQ